MRRRIQEEIDGVSAESYDAIVLGYALCGNGLAGLRARTLPIVIPRAHDCITLLMGHRAKYSQYIQANRNVYFRSAGWVEYGEQVQQQIVGLGIHCTFAELVERYGEENAHYLYEECTRYERSYDKLTYIESGIEPTGTFAERACAEAEAKGWQFERFAGDLSLFRRLLSGEWQEDFLIVPPGHAIAPTYDEDIVKAIPV
jgi:hypothetical protein